MGNLCIGNRKAPSFITKDRPLFPDPDIAKHCAGCGKEMDTHVVREYKNGFMYYWCSYKCFQKPYELQSMSA